MKEIYLDKDIIKFNTIHKLPQLNVMYIDYLKKYIESNYVFPKDEDPVK